MGQVVDIKEGNFGDISLNYSAGVVSIVQNVPLVTLLKAIAAKTTNTVELGILNAAIAALGG